MEINNQLNVLISIIKTQRHKNTRMAKKDDLNTAFTHLELRAGEQLTPSLGAGIEAASCALLSCI